MYTNTIAGRHAADLHWQAACTQQQQLQLASSSSQLASGLISCLTAIVGLVLIFKTVTSAYLF